MRVHPLRVAVVLPADYLTTCRFTCTTIKASFPACAVDLSASLVRDGIITGVGSLEKVEQSQE